MATKKTLGRYFLLSYPNFSEEFIVPTDYRRIQIGG